MLPKTKKAFSLAVKKLHAAQSCRELLLLVGGSVCQFGGWQQPKERARVGQDRQEI